MSFTAIGVAIPPLGFACQTYAARSAGPAGFEARRRFYSVDPLMLRTRQAPKIPIDLEHGHLLVGEVAHLEIALNGSLWAVATMHGDLPDTTTPLYWSVRHNSFKDGSDVRLERIAVVERPAMIGTEPLTFLPGELREHNLRYTWRVPELERGVLSRAVEARARRGKDEAIMVGDVDTRRGDAREDREVNERFVLEREIARLETRIAVAARPGR